MRDNSFGERPRPNEGEVGKFWIDEIRFYKNGQSNVVNASK